MQQAGSRGEGRGRRKEGGRREEREGTREEGRDGWRTSSRRRRRTVALKRAGWKRGTGMGEGEIREDEVLPVGGGPRWRVLRAAGQAGGAPEGRLKRRLPNPSVRRRQSLSCASAGTRENRREAV